DDFCDEYSIFKVKFAASVPIKQVELLSDGEEQVKAFVVVEDDDDDDDEQVKAFVVVEDDDDDEQAKAFVVVEVDDEDDGFEIKLDSVQ
ncbi:unnamed protein product, partial [Rotaria magnacalcarata]